MDKLVYTAATGMRSHMAAQSAIANNMANVSTIGFRADRVVFDRIDLKGGGAAFEARMPTAEEVTDADRAPGTVQHTGNPLDVAIATSSAWLAVQSPDGSEAYTRRGDLEVTASGVLQTGDGYPVIGQNGPITVPPYNSLSVSPDGTVSIIPTRSLRTHSAMPSGSTRSMQTSGRPPIHAASGPRMNMFRIVSGSSTPMGTAGGMEPVVLSTVATSIRLCWLCTAPLGKPVVPLV